MDRSRLEPRGGAGRGAARRRRGAHWSSRGGGAAGVRGTVRGQTTAGAYMELTSDRRASLLGAESPAAGSAEIHEMRMEGNVMRMRAVPRLELPPGKTVELRPGGHHMMLVGLKRPLKKGDLIPIHLKIELSDKTVKTIQI